MVCQRLIETTPLEVVRVKLLVIVSTITQKIIDMIGPYILYWCTTTSNRESNHPAKIA